MLRKTSVSIVIVLSLIAAASAQTYPTKPVRIVVPFPPGGGTDIVARAVGQKLSEALGQTFVIDNRGGAGGTIGSEAAAKSPADGYTLAMATSSTHGVAPSLYPKLGYDPVRDFAPVTLVATTPFVLVVHPALPMEQMSLREIDRAVRETVDRAFNKAVDILQRRRQVLDEGAQSLLQKETLVEEDLLRLVGAPAAA